MRKTTQILAGLTVLAALLAMTVSSQTPATRTFKVLELKSVPDGHYRVHLQAEGRERLVNLEITGNSAKAVNSNEPRFEGLAGKFELIGNGVFTVSLHNRTHRATQFWLFQPDGSAIVREIPDRGEKQRAVPVAGDSLRRSGESR